MAKLELDHPLAIAMWDFSWLERRWPGAGYEDWGLALDELVERGYDAVRIDAYPHFHAQVDPAAPRDVLPCWNQQDWGTPARTTVSVQPALVDFILACAKRGVRVALSSWYQRDPDDLRVLATTPALHAAHWIAVLDHIERAGLTDTLLFVDCCNEWPFKQWAPFFHASLQDAEAQDKGAKWSDDLSQSWMDATLAAIREHHPDLPYTFSEVFAAHRADQSQCLPRSIDLIETHIWMAHGHGAEYYNELGYVYERWDSSGYEKVQRDAERLYRDRPDHWAQGLYELVDDAAAWSQRIGKPLVTTEGWGVVDYKDWPLLEWDWVKEITAKGVVRAASTGRWAAICTSNFCGPQFVGMWRDVAWHRRLTDTIHQSELPQEARRPQAARV